MEGLPTRTPSAGLINYLGKRNGHCSHRIDGEIKVCFDSNFISRIILRAAAAGVDKKFDFSFCRRCRNAADCAVSIQGQAIGQIAMIQFESDREVPTAAGTDSIAIFPSHGGWRQDDRRAFFAVRVQKFDKMIRMFCCADRQYAQGGNQHDCQYHGN